ncbi:MAG: nicotinate phosphoribosyltransferase [Candidatus Bathyarchaeia archaeon]|jgi:nicotinate phosphoribosyltransferase|nr:nicotinate phosphoribosyltransferase [Candidatus Bathyarchaeota archaeon A05DMB-4]MDH7594956.1 nicotinate phosphoribosyltransferase [Candidatus Bathyarchaeota archaeon]
MSTFHIASDAEIKRGETTDIYFVRTEKILKAKKLGSVSVVADVTTSGLPENWPWAVLCGIEEEARLFEGIPVNIYSMSEGTIFAPEDYYGFRVPAMFIEGQYGRFCIYETPMLGLICQASGAATQAARIRKVAGNKTLLSFGIRRMHPAISPMLDRAAYIGGFDAVSSLSGAKIIGTKPTGTMPHALIIMLGDQVKAWKAFDEIIEKDAPRVALVDTYFDEKIEAIMAAEALGKRLAGVRLDTPGSRKGNFAEIVKEVRWELNLRGYNHVKIFVSGGLNEKSVKTLSEAGADGFGVGTCISNAPTVDFAMDIIEKQGKPCAKRGKIGGKKQVWRCYECMVDILQPYTQPQPKCPKCGGKTAPMLQPLIKNGKIVAKLPKPKEIRDYVLKQLEKVGLEKED